MPKLSHAKRHRKNLNLAACCCNHDAPVIMLQTPRRVSEEDIQNNDGSSYPTSQQQQQQQQQLEPDVVRTSLKRPAPSRSLAEMMQEDLEPQTPRTGGEYSWDDDNNNQESSRLSPIWGHFVDVILEDEEQSDSNTSVRLVEDDCADWPYLFAKKQRKEQRPRIRSPGRPSSSSLEGFVLQDPASLPDTILPEALARLRM